jgi:hypothetical protein
VISVVCSICFDIIGSCRKDTFESTHFPSVTLEISNFILRTLSLHVHRCDCTSIHSTTMSIIYNPLRRFQAACLAIVHDALVKPPVKPRSRKAAVAALVYMYSLSTKAASCPVALCRHDPCSAGSSLSCASLYRSARNYLISFT